MKRLVRAWIGVAALFAAPFAAPFACSSADPGADGLPGGGRDSGGTFDASDGASADADDAAIDAQDAEPATPAVRFIGRFDPSHADGPKVGYPGASIIARFSGTGVKATFADAMIDTDYGLSRWQVSVDGAPTNVLSIKRAKTAYTLATGLPAGTHTVELVKLTEGMAGTSHFMGFEFEGGALLAPPPAAARHLEFVGDSASNGYGIEGASSSCPYSTATQNELKTFPALAAAALGADHHNISGSGRGLYWNLFRADPDVFSVLYLRTLPFAQGSTWSFADYTPDLVWMMLGGNDYDQPNAGDPAPPFNQFQAKYDQMVVLIRSKRPTAHIVCAVAPSLNDYYPVGYDAYTNVKTAATSVVNKYRGQGDAKLSVFEFTRSTSSDTTACDYHPNAAKHQTMATEAIAHIKSVTGWP